MREHIRDVPFLKTARSLYASYGKHILGFRHFAASQDGLKPVQRRAVWSAYEIGAVSKQKMVLGSFLAGHAFGHYHPHAEGSVYKAMANITQANTLAPLFVGVGNWGSHDSGPAAARYPSCFLSSYALTMLDPVEIMCVPMDKSYSGKHEEPRFLPARLPHLLLAGCSSLAAGYNGNIPPSRIDWVLEAMHCVMQGKDLPQPRGMQYRWGGRMLSLDKDWINSGIGVAEFLPRHHIEGLDLVFTTLAPGMGVASIEKRLEKFDGFAGMTEESPKQGDMVRIIARVKRGFSAKQMAVYAEKMCMSREHYSFLHISQRTDSVGDVTYDPIIEGPSKFLTRWVKWRKQIVAASAQRRADVLRAEAARLDLMVRAVDCRRELLKILDVSKTRDDLKLRTSKLLRCTNDEVNQILSLSWPQLAKLERTDLLASKSDKLKLAKTEDEIVRQPTIKIIPEAESAASALTQTKQLVQIKK